MSQTIYYKLIAIKDIFDENDKIIYKEGNPFRDKSATLFSEEFIKTAKEIGHVMHTPYRGEAVFIPLSDFEIKKEFHKVSKRGDL